jgi:glycosyltransferase involved in cell wall biosynthesis
MTERVVAVLPSFAGGGAERVMLTFLRALDRARFAPAIVAFDGAGPLRALVPTDVTVEDLARPRLRHALPALIATLRRLDPAVIVSTLGYVNLALLAARPLLPRRARLIVREANLPVQSLSTVPHPALMRAGYRLLYPRAGAVVCGAWVVANSLARDFGVPPRLLRVLYNPVDDAAARAAAATPVREPGPGPRFVAAGRLTVQKGFDRLLDMMAELPSDARLIILGEGPERAALSAQATRLGLAGRVTFTGFDPAPWARYAGADAFLLPSRWEGMPNAALEALACGTKVIATPEAGGIGEVAALASAGAVTVAAAGPAFIAALRTVAADPPRAPRPSLLPASFRLAPATAAFAALLDQTAVDNAPARRAA